MKEKEFSTILAITPCVIMFFPMKSFTMPAVKDTDAQGDRDRCLSPQTLVPEPADTGVRADRRQCLARQRPVSVRSGRHPVTVPLYHQALQSVPADEYVAIIGIIVTEKGKTETFLPKNSEKPPQSTQSKA